MTDAPASPGVVPRTMFRTSRLADFTSKRELILQTGHAVEDWPLVVVKELADNALDACEEAGLEPVIDIDIGSASIAVSDNGPGLSTEAISSMLDYNHRVSSREAYVSPARGAQGNALKTILAMPFALHGEHGTTTVESHGVAHEIAFSIDPVRRQPHITHETSPSLVKTGTRVIVFWPNSACWMLDQAKDRFLQVARDFAWMNPHVTIRARWRCEDAAPVELAIEPATPSWPKWAPSAPSSPHWFDVGRFGRLIAAYIAHAEDHALPCKTVREFVSEFRGPSGSAKTRTICDQLGVSRMSLAKFYGDGDLARPHALLEAMKRESRPVKSKDLGLIGKDCLFDRLVANGVVPDSFEYRCGDIVVEGSPYLLEVAFGYRGDDEDRILVSGINWSPAIGANPFRSLRHNESLDTILANQYCDDFEGVALFVHLAAPKVSYVDRGKSAVTLPREVGNAIADLVEKVTTKWARQRKAEDRRASAQVRRDEALLKSQKAMSIRDAAFQIMPQAYLAASDGGTLPANARQLFYQARPLVMELTGTRSLDSQYFCQTLLTDYLEHHDVNWDVIWDDRGHFREPHTGRVIGLGTLAVRRYVGSTGEPTPIEAGYSAAAVETCGPTARFGACLFLEKEGFQPIIDAARLAERFDLAIMSSKGMSVTAARELADHLATYNIPLLTLHDFDISGFSIGSTVGTDSRRYEFANSVKVINLGLRLVDVIALGLPFEPVHVAEKAIDAIEARLKRCGATSEEIDVLKSGRRCELNAMTSAQFVQFLERKLIDAGVKKVVPVKERLDDTYRLFARGERFAKAIEEILAFQVDQPIAVPASIERRVDDYLAQHPAATWDEAVRQIWKAWQ